MTMRKFSWMWISLPDLWLSREIAFLIWQVNNRKYQWWESIVLLWKGKLWYKPAFGRKVFQQCALSSFARINESGHPLLLRSYFSSQKALSFMFRQATSHFGKWLPIFDKRLSKKEGLFSRNGNFLPKWETLSWTFLGNIFLKHFSVWHGLTKSLIYKEKGS